MHNFNMNVIVCFVLAAFVAKADAFWRLSCGRIQTGRIDPIINPGAIAGHAHTISGPINFNTSSTFESLQAAYCTSCSIQDDKSAYWTPLMYYRYRNGTYVDVPHGGTVVYYLSRGDDELNMVPFPEGYKVLAGDAAVRSYNTQVMTYGGNATKKYNNRPVADRTSFACLDYDNPSPETPRLTKTNCPGGLRAQIHFPSCWDGKNVYKSDQSHVAYMSGIDTGVCPPSHPKLFPHLFFEVIYSPNNVKQEKGGYFVFSNGDTTGYGFHGDFQNGWKTSVMEAAIKQCMGTGRAINEGSIQKCPPLNASYDDFVTKNCPEQPPLLKEKVKGLLKTLPGCNPPTGGPMRAAQAVCPIQPDLNPVDNLDNYVRKLPVVGDLVSVEAAGGVKGDEWEYIGCGFDQGSPKMLTGEVLQEENTMTISRCASYCNSKAWGYAGVSNGYQCYCGNVMVNALQSQGVCSAQAHIVCNGNNLQYCGGQNIVHVYKNTKATIDLKGTPRAKETKITFKSGDGKSDIEATYAGCFPEPNGGRALAGGTSFSNETGMTNQLCGTFCQYRGFNLFGTEFQKECYCGNSVSTTAGPETGCIAYCKGDNTRFCGNGGKLSLWTINGTVPSVTTNNPTSTSTPTPGANPGAGDGLDLVVPAPNAQYVNCVSEIGGSRTLSSVFLDKASVMSVDYCAALAKQKNYAYFGLEYGQQCLLGDVVAPTAQKYAANKCNVKCKANAAQTCGGSGAISLYNNTAYTPRIVQLVKIPDTDTTYEYRGCYSDNGGARTLGGQGPSAISKNFGADGSVDKCLTFCKLSGFSWGGITFGSECYCNNVGIQNNAQLRAGGDADCNMPCKGDETQNCGQSGIIQVYQVKLGVDSSGSRTSNNSKRRRRIHTVRW